MNYTHVIKAKDDPMCLDFISILAFDDSLVEADETYSISLSSNSSIVNIDEPIMWISIRDNDGKHYTEAM